MSLSTDEIIKYFTQKQYFPSLATWSFQLNELYNQFPTLKAMITEGIDLKESPTMNFNDIQNELYAKIGINVKLEGEGDAQTAHIEHKPELMNFEGLQMSVINLTKQGISDGSILIPSFLQNLASMHYYNKVLKHRYMGFGAEVLIPDAYWHWDWAASIANLCTSFMPVFQRLTKRDLFLFPEIDKPIKECMSIANSFLTFLQGQNPSVRVEELMLGDNEAAVGQDIIASDVNNTKGGILVEAGSHVVLGDTLIKTKKPDITITLDMGDKETQFPWTVAKVYVRPGEKLMANRRLMAVTALTIRAEQGRFMKLFFDVYRQVGRIRKTAMFLKEAIEEEIRSGGGIGGVENEGGGVGAGFKPQTNRFANLDMQPEEIENTSTALDLSKKDVASMGKKIRTARARITT